MKFTRTHYDTVRAAARWQRCKGPLPRLRDLQAAIAALDLPPHPKATGQTPTDRRKAMATLLAENLGRAEDYGRPTGFLPPGRKTTVADLEHAQQMEALRKQIPRGPLVIRIEGGLVQGVSWEGPEMEVVVRDYDTDGADPADLTRDERGDLLAERRLTVDDRREWRSPLLRTRALARIARGFTPEQD